MNKLIRFILQAEAGIPDSRMPASLPAAFEFARRSGWSHDPRDAGGATMCGLTLKTYTAWCRSMGYQVPSEQDLRQVPFANWKAVFKNNFWDFCRASEISSPEIAYIIVDWVWGSGPKVIRIIQKILHTKPDGVIGPKTLAAINARQPLGLWKLIYQERLCYIIAISPDGSKNSVFRRGWISRLDKLPIPMTQ